MASWSKMVEGEVKPELRLIDQGAKSEAELLGCQKYIHMF